MAFFTSISERRRALRLLLRALGVVLLGLVVLDGVGRVGLRLSPFPLSERWYNRDDSFDQDARDAQIVTLGTSHAGALLPGILGRPVLELWASGQVIAGSATALSFFASQADSAKLILRPISIGELILTPESFPTALMRLDAVLIRHDFGRALAMYFPDKAERFLLGSIAHIARPDNWRGPLWTLLHEPSRLWASPHAPAPRFREAMVAPFDPKWVAHRLVRVLSRMARPDTTARFRRIGLGALDRLVATAERMDACLVLVESPVSAAYRDAFLRRRPDLKDWKKVIRGRVARWRASACVVFLEGLWSEAEAATVAYYRDADHLNRRGAERFSRRLRACLTVSEVAFFNQPFRLVSDRRP